MVATICILPTENKGFAPQTPENDENDENAGVTQEKAWFRKNRKMRVSLR